MAHSAKNRFSILLVEDEPGDVDLVRLALARGRFSCHVAVTPNGREALAFLRKEAPAYAEASLPDIVLLDLNMPQMNGWEVLREIAGDSFLKHIPVIVFTTSDNPQDITECYVLGASGFITKPADIDELFRVIHGLQEYWFSIVRLPAISQSRT